MNRGDALDVFVETLELLVPIAKAVPALGQTVEGALEAAIRVIKLAQGVHTVKEDARELASEAARWTGALISALTAAPPALLPVLQGHLEEMTGVLDEIARLNESRAKQSMLSALLSKSRDAEETTRLRVKLRAAYERFMVAAQIRHNIALASVAEAQARSEQSISEGHSRHDAALDAITASQTRHDHILPTLLSDADREVLKSLSPILSARHNSSMAPPGCLERTRENVLRLLDDWVQQRTSQLSIFWLAGMGGTGKTTLAKTFCDRIAKDGKTVASFFISRNEEPRKDPSNLVRTMAYTLAYALPRSRKPILDAVRSFPDVLDASLEELVGDLIASPFSVGRDSDNADEMVVLVIDALDECKKIGTLEGGQLVPLLATTLKNLPVKLLITSRMEPSILNMFSLLNPASVRLHDIEKDIVASDVRHYFENKLAEIRRAHQIGDMDWPSARDVEELTNKAGHLFIYASTVMRYVGNDQHNPRARLQQVLEPGPTSSASPYRLVDDLYLQVLRSAVNAGEDDEDEEMICRRLRSILGAVVFVQTPLTPHAIASLLAVDVHELRMVLQRLSAFLLAVLDLPVRLFHLSFSDFIMDASRCKDVRFRLDPKEHHQVLAARCLTTLNNQLHRDMCSIRDLTRTNAEVSDLPRRLEHSVSLELGYAAVSWIHHATLSVATATDVFDALATFCDEHILHWLELLSLLGQLSSASKGLPVLLSWLKAQSRVLKFEESFSLLEDAANIVREYFIPISSNALQVYHSVLVFMPDCCLSRRLGQSAQPVARMLTPRESTWTHPALMLEGHTAKVNSVSLSSDGSSMVSCSSDGTVRIWDVSTGEPRAVFTEQGVPVTSATFSPDGLRVAVGDLHGSICEWDISTGLKVARIPPDDSKIFGLAHYNSRDGASIHHEQSKILCLAYSRDGARIISCSKTKICFMDLATTQLLRVVHARDLGFVAVEIQTIAPDGSRVCLQDRSPFRVNTGLLQIWDIRGHADLVHRTDLGSSSYLARLEFSSDGHRAAFLTQERALELVNFDDGVHVVYSTLSPFQGHLGHVFAVSSTSAGSVAFGSLNNVLLLRDSSSSSPAAAQSLTTLGRHTTRVNCMAFSFDGARAVSGSEAGTVGIWETKVDVRGPGPSSLPASSSRALIDMTLQSQDGSRLICVFSNSLIEVYDTTSGTVLNALDLSLVLPRATYRSRTFWMAMSPNSLRLAFCVETESEDTEYLHIWDLEASRVLDCVDRVRYEDTYSESTPFTLGPSDANKTCCPLVWSPDGARCAMVIFGRKVHIWNAISGQMEAVWDLPKFPEITRTLPDGSASPEHEVVSNILHHVEFSRNGRQLLVIASTDNHALQCIWYSPTSTSHVSSAFYPKDIFPGHTISFGEGSAFSPDGTHLTSYSRKKKELYLRSIDTNPSRDNGEPRFIHDWHDTIEPVVWSCDGSQVALMISGTVLVWRVKMVAANPCVVLTFRYDMAEVYVKTIEELAPSLLIRRYQPLDCYFRPHRLLAFSTDGHRICVCSLKEEVHWRAGTDFQVPSLLRDDPAQRSLAVTDASVDIIASDHSGWLLCSRADRSKLVPLIWVPPQRRWKTARDVQVVGSKVTFQSASRQFVTILDFPSLQDLYRLSESDGVSDSQQPDPKPYTKIGSETDSKTGSDLPPGRASCHIDTVLRIQ